MQTYANALLIAIPSFLLLIIIETVYDHFRKKRRDESTYKALDTISSLSSGVTNVLKDSLGLLVIIISYPFMVDNLALIEIESTWLVVLIGFIAKDFAGYWTHRVTHSVNCFWNRHIIHHSSEEFNLACALRQSISSIFGIFSIFLLPAALFGVPSNVIAIIAPLHLFLQFWYHTQHIGKLGWLEYIIVTPSQHRVHHAINPEYIDKNLGQIFCIWDRMFGTFQEEMDDVPPVYGITRPVKTWNPIKINFLHMWLLIKDAWRTNNWLDKLKIWWMPTGWRPADVVERFPVAKIDDVYNFRKYNTKPSRFLIRWSYYQLSFTVLLLLYMFYSFSAIGFPNLFIYAGLMAVGIWGYTSLMDKEKSAFWVELIRGAAGVAFLLYTGDWLNLSEMIPFGQYLVVAYFISVPIGAMYIARTEISIRSDVTNQPTGLAT
ncbi:MAG: sterol desaturase family protein [Bacteroidota bacterium]